MMKMNLELGTLFLFEEEVDNIIKDIFESAGFLEVKFDEVNLRKDEIKLYFEDYYMKIWFKDDRWQVWVFDRHTHKETEVDVNTRALIELLENKLNN